MSIGAGNERVLTALAETLRDLEPVDLTGSREDSEPPATELSRRYVEQAEIGRGGLGVVMEAFDQDLRRTAALKRPRDDRLDDDNRRALVREAQVTAQLEHPNIPAVYNLGIDEVGRPFFTMTRLYGRSLAELLAARSSEPDVAAQLTTPRLLRIFLQIGYALAFAHDRGVLHRDLKAANVVIGAFGEVRLVDWGVAKLLGADDAADGGEVEEPLARPLETTVDHAETAAGTFVGTLGYASPEQARGDRGIDARSDVYALGALLYEMLAGKPPVTGRTVQEVLYRTLAGDIDPIGPQAPISDRLAAIVHKALATDPADRYAQVLDMLEDVEAFLEGRPVTARAEGAFERTRRWYAGRSPRGARMRNVDLDLAIWAAFMLGAASGTLVFYLPEVWWGPLAWLFTAIGLLTAAPPLYTYLRKARPEDPGVVLPFREGAQSTGRSRRSSGRRASAPADPHAPTEVAGRGEGEPDA